LAGGFVFSDKIPGFYQKYRAYFSLLFVEFPGIFRDKKDFFLHFL
jgi:hypothetical protein